MQIYKIKNTRLKLESRIFHLHKIFYSAEKNNTGRIWIKKRRVKTGVLSRIPLLPIAKLILDRYTGGEKLLPIQDPADRKGVINETYHWWLL